MVVSSLIVFDDHVYAASYDDGVRAKYGDFHAGHGVYLENIYNGIILTASYTAWDDGGWAPNNTGYLYVPKKYGHVKVIPNLCNGTSGVYLGMYAYMIDPSYSGQVSYLFKAMKMYALNPTISYDGDYIVVSFNRYATQSLVDASYPVEERYYLWHIYDSNTSGVLMHHPALDVESITGSASGGGHNWSGSTTATCTTAGVRTCSMCGYTETQSALGHSWNYGGGSVYQNRTCTLPELRYNYCTRCGTQSGTTQTQPAMGHNWGSGNGAVTQNQSCTAPEIRYNKCTRCSATNGTKQTKSAMGHDYQTATLTNNNGVKVPADVYHDAVYYQKCSRCSTGHSGDPYTNHYNAVPGTQKHFSIYIGDKRVQAIYIGNTPIMGANIGNNSLVA